MKIIYHCYGGTHSSVTAAGIHLGILPRDRLPAPEELTGQKLYDRQRECDAGKIIFMGQDRLGNDVYVVGRRSRPQLLYEVTEVLSDIFNIDMEKLMLVDVSLYINSSMRAGGFMSRKMGLARLGRPIVTWGTLRNYHNLVAVVDKVYTRLKQTPVIPKGRPVHVINPEVVC